MGLSTTYTKTETDFLIQKLEEKTSDKYNDEPNSIANDIIKFIDINTGENVNYRETTTWYDNSVMDDNKVDGVVYIKKNGKYYKLSIGNEIDLRLFGFNEKTPDISIINKAIDCCITFDKTLYMNFNEFILPSTLDFKGVQLKFNKSSKIYIDTNIDGIKFKDKGHGIDFNDLNIIVRCNSYSRIACQYTASDYVNESNFQNNINLLKKFKSLKISNSATIDRSGIGMRFYYTDGQIMLLCDFTDIFIAFFDIGVLFESDLGNGWANSNYFHNLSLWSNNREMSFLGKTDAGWGDFQFDGLMQPDYNTTKFIEVQNFNGKRIAPISSMFKFAFWDLAVNYAPPFDRRTLIDSSESNIYINKLDVLGVFNASQLCTPIKEGLGYSSLISFKTENGFLDSGTENREAIVNYFNLYELKNMNLSFNDACKYIIDKAREKGIHSFYNFTIHIDYVNLSYEYVNIFKVFCPFSGFNKMEFSLIPNNEGIITRLECVTTSQYEKDYDFTKTKIAYDYNSTDNLKFDVLSNLNLSQSQINDFDNLKLKKSPNYFIFNNTSKKIQYWNDNVLTDM